MPAFSTHYIFAKELINELQTISPVKLSQQAVFIGAQGPDIFFFHRVFPWMKGTRLAHIGTKLHHSKPSDIFNAMKDYIAISENKNIANSYMYGFMLHYALDRKCHPLVFALEADVQKDKRYRLHTTAHNKIEFSFDAYLINKKLGYEKPYEFYTAGTVEPNEAEIKEIAKMIAYTSKEVLGIDMGDAGIEVLADEKYVLNFMHNANGNKEFLVKLLDIPVSLASKGFKFDAMLRPKNLDTAKKYININHEGWKSPYSNYTSNESLEDLYEAAKPEAVTMIAELIAGKDTYEITNNISFITGVEENEANTK